MTPRTLGTKNWHHIMLNLDLQCDKEKRWNVVDLMQILHRGEKTTFQLMDHFSFMRAMSDHVLH